MKAVGVKMLKNNLSRYLDLVRKGEVILVTDRDEVIAELRMPTEPSLSRASPWIAFLETQARRGAVRLAERKRSTLTAAESQIVPDVRTLLEDERQDRF